MIQSYNQLKNQIEIVSHTATGTVYIQKIYSTSFFICLSLRCQGKTWFLYIGRGHGKEGIWIDDKKPESFLRKRDHFLEYFRKHLGSSLFDSITCDENDRVFSLNYQKWGHLNKLMIFYNGRNLNFCHHFFDPKSHLMKAFYSWTTKTEVIQVLDFSCFDEIGRTTLDKTDLNVEVKTIAQLLAEEKKQALAGSTQRKSMKFFNRKKKRILGDLKNVSEIPNLRQLAENKDKLEALPIKNKLNGIKLRFQYNDFYKRRDEVYKKIKKLQKAETILNLRLEDTEKSIKGHGEENLTNNLKTTPVVWNLKNKSKIEEKKVALKQYKVIDLGRIQMGIGISAVGNDQLRTEWGKKGDFWFHLDGDKSAHVIIKLLQETLDETILQVAASALVEFSQVEYSTANIIYTQVKNLKGVKGVPGKVIFKKEKRIQIDINQAWREAFSTGAF